MIYVNGRFLTQKLTGVNRFAFELTKAMYEMGMLVKVICPNQEIRSEYEISTFDIIKYGFGSSHVWEIFSLPLYFIGKKNSIVISFTGAGHIWGPDKMITIHDLAFKKNPKWYSWSYRMLYNILTPIAIWTSKSILTVSNFSKTEIVNLYNVNPNKIHVVYNACNADWNINKKSDDQAQDYFLCVSSVDPRKNFPILIEAFKQLPNEKLKIVGSYNRVFGNTRLEELSNVEMLGRVSDEDLALLYKNAKGFIYPSLYEGFGLPPIEAMHFGCPVLVSDILVLREVCSDAAIYFDPMSAISVCNAVLRMSTLSAEKKEKLVEKGYINLQRFSWINSASKLKQIIESL